MGTTLTPEDRQRCAVLLLVAMGATFVLSAVRDALALRTARRRARTPEPSPAHPVFRLTPADTRPTMAA